MNELYEVMGSLGEGAFGKVKQVRYTLSGQIRAMKIINRAAFKKSGNEEMLEREINILKELVFASNSLIHTFSKYMSFSKTLVTTI